MQPNRAEVYELRWLGTTALGSVVMWLLIGGLAWKWLF
jgi:hypothetical protein